MTNQSTIDKLLRMRLLHQWQMRQVTNSMIPIWKEVTEDRFGMLVDIEYSNQNNRLKHSIHNAGFDQPEANIMDINYTSGRKLNKKPH